MGANSDPTKSSGLTHLDDQGRARMVDVTAKDVTLREAEATCRVTMASATLALIVSGQTPKGDVFAVARIAGIMAAKRTPELIPLCHGLSLGAAEVEFETREGALEIRACVRTEAKTGVEMEALTAVAVAALTVYDMCKAIDRTMRIDAVRVTYKAGGRSGTFRAED